MSESKTKVAYHFFSNTRAIIEEAGGILGDFKFFFVGLALTIFGLFLLFGGVAVGLVVLFVAAGYSALVATLISLLAIGIIGFAAGVLLAKHMFEKLRGVYKKHEAKHLHKHKEVDEQKEKVIEVRIPEGNQTEKIVTVEDVSKKHDDDEEEIQNLRILD